MKTKKWENFSFEEIKNFLMESKTKKEFCEKLGYNSHFSRIIKSLLEKYPDLDYSHLEQNGKLKDLTGQRFGKLVVKERYVPPDEKYKYTYWICECDCGNTTNPIIATNLTRGMTVSCGCYHKQRQIEGNQKDLSGKVFGKLMALYRIKEKNKNYWVCKCSCGKLTRVATSDLNNGHTQSCGCLRSRGEAKISNILNDNNIYYISQYTFKDLKSRKNGLLKFDFAIFQNQSLFSLIEYQGEQHYKEVDAWGGREEFIYRQENDNLKREYCKKNGIKLVEISYKDFKNLSYNFLKEVGGIY